MGARMAKTIWRIRAAGPGRLSIQRKYSNSLAKHLARDAGREREREHRTPPGRGNCRTVPRTNNGAVLAVLLRSVASRRDPVPGAVQRGRGPQLGGGGSGFRLGGDRCVQRCESLR
jgi:hypothetical protein